MVARPGATGEAALMHVGEERFRSIRMSEHEFAALNAAFAELIREHEIDIAFWPILDKFLGAMGYTAGYHDEGEVVVDVALEEDE